MSKEHGQNIMSPQTKRLLEQMLSKAESDKKDAHLSIGEAGGTNDWHDNPALDQAHLDAKMTNLRVEKLREMLKDPTIIRPRSDTDVVDVGNAIILDFGDGFPEEVNLLGVADATYNTGFISNESPIGKAILGRHVGEEVKYVVDERTMTVKIIQIKKGGF